MQMFSKVDSAKRNEFLDSAKAAREERMQRKRQDTAAITIQVGRLYNDRGKTILKFSFVPRASTAKFFLVLTPYNLSEIHCQMPMISLR